MAPDQLLHGWTPRRIGRRLVVLAETASTNTAALESLTTLGGADGREADGLVVFADFQTSGRGRQGRQWLSPRGAGVLCSTVLVPTSLDWPTASLYPGANALEPASPSPALDPASRFSGWLTLASAVAACEAVRQATEITPAIKWPNDLRVSGRKLGGILIESRPLGGTRRAWVIGIGINCLQHRGHFPPELRDVASSLEIEASHPIDRLEVARSLLKQLDKWLAMPLSTGPTSPDALLPDVHSAWQHYAEPIGQRVHVRSQGQDYTGRTIAVDPFGGLIVQTDGGKRQWFDPVQTSIL